MGWSDCGDDSKGRPIGYAFRAPCDFEGCETEIDRGLAYACGGMHGDDDPHGSCEGYFCGGHLYGHGCDPEPLGEPPADEAPKAGDRVRVVWSGGNGPHEYLVVEQHGKLYTQTEWEREHDKVDTVKSLDDARSVEVLP